MEQASVLAGNTSLTHLHANEGPSQKWPLIYLFCRAAGHHCTNQFYYTYNHDVAPGFGAKNCFFEAHNFLENAAIAVSQNNYKNYAIMLHSAYKSALKIYLTNKKIKKNQRSPEFLAFPH